MLLKQSLLCKVISLSAVHATLIDDVTLGALCSNPR